MILEAITNAYRHWCDNQKVYRSDVVTPTLDQFVDDMGANVDVHGNVVVKVNEREFSISPSGSIFCYIDEQHSFMWKTERCKIVEWDENKNPSTAMTESGAAPPKIPS